MKKEKWHMILKIMSVMLIISFFLRLAGDYYKIYIGDTDIFPFYICVIVRSLEFIIPSIIIFICSKYFEGKYNNKEEK